MKNYLKFLTLLLIGNLLFSCSEQFTEEDAMEALQLITLQIGVLDASSDDAAISGAAVRAVVGTETVTATTDTNGVAVFEEVEVGNYVNIYVTKDNYTTIFDQVSTTPGDYRQTVVSDNVYMYSLSGDNIATVEGTLTIETDLTNREREVLSGIEVMAYNESLSSTTQYFTDTTDATGEYSISVPINSSGGDDIYVYFPSLEMDRTVGRNIGNVYSTETKTATYSATNYVETAVEQVPSALLKIGDPPTQGSGFALSTSVVSDNLSNQISNVTIVNGGSGYGTGAASESITYDFSAGTGGTAQITFNVQEGIINSFVSITDNGATYTSKPTIGLTGGSGAIITFEYERRYEVSMTSGGSGYLTYPTVGAKYFIYNASGLLEQEIDNDITTTNEISATNLFSNTSIIDGVITSETSSDSLFTTYYLAGDSVVFKYVNPTVTSAFAYIGTGSINSDSSLSGGYNLSIAGSGYDPGNVPTIEVEALAGYGSGAEWEIEVASGGTVNQLIMINNGSGYTDDINDYDGDGISSEEEDAEMTGFYTWNTTYGYGGHYNVKPGRTYTGDVFYGTGTVKE